MANPQREPTGAYPAVVPITLADSTVAYATAVVQYDSTGNPVSGGSGATSQVQGDRADRTTDGGNSVKVGGVFDNAYGGLTTGQRGPLRITAGGDLYVAGGSNTTFVSPYSGQLSFIKATSAAAYPVASSGLLLSSAGWIGAPADTAGAWVKQPPLTGTDRSISAGATAQTLMAANTTRSKFYVKNDSAVDVWVNVGATASATPGSGNLKIAATGGYLELTGTSAAISIFAASTAAVTAREF